MPVSTARNTMLYCPKCNRTYEEGSQRFCSIDGIRLLPASGRSSNQAKSVFANILKHKIHGDGENDGGHLIGSFDQVPPIEAKPHVTSRVFEPVKKEPVRPQAQKESQDARPTPRLIRAHEIPPSQAQLGDRSQKPVGREALTWENTSILIGQTIKGRYQIIEKMNEDDLSISYLAQDKLVSGRMVTVRVLMDEVDPDDNSYKLLAEERVSLSHINHPNVVHLIDSGELLEGKSFVISEYIADGESLAQKLHHEKMFSSARTARIIRQAAIALNEVHENGILHRNLKPQHIILSASNKGGEQVRVTDFAVFDGFDEQSEEAIKYLAPEQLEGRVSNFASDIYSLAVIAYRMLTGRLPFNSSKEKDLLKAQKEGLSLRPSNLRLDVSPRADLVLEKALSYKPSERFSKAREFGDALYNALMTSAPWEKVEVEVQTDEPKVPIVEKESSLSLAEQVEKPVEELAMPEIKVEPEVLEEQDIIIEDEETPLIESSEVSETNIPEASLLEETAPVGDVAEPETKKDYRPFKGTRDLPWEKRSPEPPKEATTSKLLLFGLGLLLLGLGTWAIWAYFSKRPAAPAYVQQPADKANENADNQNNGLTAAEKEKINSQQQAQSTPMDIDSPPLPRKISQPPDTIYFQNSKENLKGDLVRNFRAFSFYYPNDWTNNPATTNFVDVARIGATGTPIEQFLVNYYESKGTFASDADRFPKLVEKSEIDLKKSLDGKFTLLSQGETKINGDWKAYEMKFQGEGLTKNGDKITLWGRRLWIPAARPGTRSGFIITMLATSLSPEVKSADDVGVKGELASVLETFEPTSMDIAY